MPLWCLNLHSALSGAGVFGLRQACSIRRRNRARVVEARWVVAAPAGPAFQVRPDRGGLGQRHHNSHGPAAVGALMSMWNTRAISWRQDSR